ncbi:MAG: polysaccharide biosynthesis C-terminal domain-containing protein [Bacteroidales bacterium]|nr:polysaccharide biosynthesis C-terminal domain-containing protein [Bacteroidales bacterium]
MFKKIAGTAFARFLNTLLGFAVVVVAARAFGAEGYGTIVLVILGIAFIQLVNSFVGGPALVYLVPRHDISKLFILSYVWALVVSVVGAILLYVFCMIPPEYRWETMLLSLISNWASVNMMILIGKEKIKLYNMISVLQTALIYISIMAFIYVLDHTEVDYYIYALCLAYLSTFFLSLASIRRYIVFSDLNEIDRPLKSILHYGGLMQLASILQFFNYRLSYYLLERFYDKASLGKFAVGVQLAEGMWLISKSVALVQYSRISNEPGNTAYAKNITLIFLKFTFIATSLMLLVLIALPSDVFVFIFGEGFAQVKPVIFSLSPGILTLSSSHIFSHYFSGSGKPQHNTKSSALGFIVVLVSGFLLIPNLGLIGAGIATSLSYITIFIYQLYWFRRESGACIREMLITASDLDRIKKELKAVFYPDVSE